MSTITALAPDPTEAPVTQQSRPAVIRYLSHCLVLAKRSLIKTMRTPEALVDVTLQPVIFLALFTYIFGGAIAGGSQSQYLQFLLPGILGQTIAMAGISLGSNLNSDIEKGVFDRFRALPIGRSAPLVGAVLADFVRYAILIVVTLGVGMIMGFRFHAPAAGVIGGIALMIGFALSFVWVSVFIGMKARTSGAVTGISMLIVMPLSFGSNVFVPTGTMPGWLQAFVNVNPMTHLVSSIRALFTGAPAGSDVLWTLGWMAALLIVFVPLAVRAYRRRV
ncbi:ABC transporter permease [Microlunatus soli]|uniref:Transport permease protein n=1 Tax=Microlunatus soli TaxID=630515 RepID=A0A1H1NGT8_9ACTN|nr:ABC transporter permease [Microlunatus soli]SDR98154.1 oleandomycin transport system permease protein [Microlunatus soli]